LVGAAKRDVFLDLVTETIDPSLRYAAYRLKTPRTQPIPSIARKHFPAADKDLVSAIRELNPGVLEDGQDGTRSDQSGADGAPQTLNWRSRNVRIEDAAIAVAWASVQAAKQRLGEKLAAANLQPKGMAAAYDELLTASQDAVDATRQAIDDLRGEGVSQSDPRMQSLQITRTAVGYEAISWRIGRNRVLIGDRDGLSAAQTSVTSKKKAGKGHTVHENDSDELFNRRLTRVKEMVVLYDGVLQSVESIRELPGVAADEDLTGQLDATFKYFQALKYDFFQPC
jgi:signal recognition particle subunit SRP68